jgi:hypothetical protein
MIQAREKLLNLTNLVKSAVSNLRADFLTASLHLHDGDGDELDGGVQCWEQPVDAGKTCCRTDPVNQISLPESEPFSYSFLPMAIATLVFVLRLRRSRLRNPGLVCRDVDDPGDLVNLEEQIPCIARCGIRSNPIWNPIVSRGNSWPYPQEAEASE